MESESTLRRAQPIRVSGFWALAVGVALAGCGLLDLPATTLTPRSDFAWTSHAWRAQHRLHRRYRHLVGHGKRPPVAVTAIARELVGFIWAAMTQRGPAA